MWGPLPRHEGDPGLALGVNHLILGLAAAGAAHAPPPQEAAGKGDIRHGRGKGGSSTLMVPRLGGYKLGKLRGILVRGRWRLQEAAGKEDIRHGRGRWGRGRSSL